VSLAQLLQAQGFAPEALEAYRRAVTCDPAHLETVLATVGLCQQLDQHALALEVIGQAQTALASQPQPYETIAEPLTNGNDGKFNASHPLPSGEGRVRDSQKKLINGRPSPAAPAATSPEGRGNDALQVKAPFQANLLNWLKGACHEALNDTAQAQAAYAEALAQAGSPQVAHRQAADWFTARGQWDKATLHWAELLALTPADTEARLALAELMRRQHRPEAAVAVLTQDLANLPAQGLVALAEAHFATDDAEAAHHALEQAQGLLTEPIERFGLELRKTLWQPAVAENDTDVLAHVQRSQASLKALAKATAPKLAGQLAQPWQTVGAAPHRLSELAAWPCADTQHAALASLASLNETLACTLPPAPAMSQAPASPLPVLGVVSRFMHPNHWLGRSLGPVFKALDREQVALHWFALEAGEASAHEAVSAWLAPQDSVTALPTTLAFEQAQTAIVNANCSTLLYTNLTTEAGGFMLGQQALAPMQAVLWSQTTPWCATAGTPTQWGEALWQTGLPNEGLPEGYALPKVVPTTVPLIGWRPLPVEPNLTLDREAFGVAYGEKLWVMNASVAMLSPWADRAIEALLAAEPKARVLVLQSPIASLNQRLQARWQETLHPHHLNAVRLAGPFRPADRLRLIQLADAVLDALPVSDTGAALEALAVGTPVVSLAQAGQALPCVAQLADWAGLPLGEHRAVASVEALPASALALAQAGAGQHEAWAHQWQEVLQANTPKAAQALLGMVKGNASLK
jgi:predicted O-linked N-acetylglucosamine transferase (SPINDLY family)